jgi:uncharacterized membrane protein YccC
VSDAERMSRKRKVWLPIWAAALVVFFGGYFARVYETRYFPYFVAFSMVFGLAVAPRNQLSWLELQR